MVGNTDGVLSTPELHGSFFLRSGVAEFWPPDGVDEMGPSGCSPHLVDVHGNPMGLALVQPSLGDLPVDHLSVYIHGFSAVSWGPPWMETHSSLSIHFRLSFGAAWIVKLHIDNKRSWGRLHVI